MRLLFDENLSPKLPHLLAAAFPDSLHVRECGLKGAPDEVIWTYAGKRGPTSVSKDADFHARGLLRGGPPKLVWLRIGNCTRDELVALVRRHEGAIRALGADPVESVLVLSPPRA